MAFSHILRKLTSSTDPKPNTNSKKEYSTFVDVTDDEQKQGSQYSDSSENHKAPAPQKELQESSQRKVEPTKTHDPFIYIMERLPNKYPRVRQVNGKPIEHDYGSCDISLKLR